MTFLQQFSEFVFVGFTFSLLIDKCSFVWSIAPCCDLRMAAMMQMILIQTESSRSAARVWEEGGSDDQQPGAALIASLRQLKVLQVTTHHLL
jgi:hypothetical protein